MAAAGLDLVHRLLPDVVDRSGYASNLVAGLLHEAALLGPVTLVSAALVPFCLLRHFAGPFRYGGRGGGIVRGLWAAAVPFVGRVATLDHTRMALLLGFAPAVAFLRAQEGGAAPRDWGLFALLFLCRLALAQVDVNGAGRATAYPLAPWVEPGAASGGSLDGGSREGALCSPSPCREAP